MKKLIRQKYEEKLRKRKEDEEKLMKIKEEQQRQLREITELKKEHKWLRLFRHTTKMFSQKTTTTIAITTAL